MEAFSKTFEPTVDKRKKEHDSPLRRSIIIYS